MHRELLKREITGGRVREPWRGILEARDDIQIAERDLARLEAQATDANPLRREIFRVRRYIDTWTRALQLTLDDVRWLQNWLRAHFPWRLRLDFSLP